MTLQERVKLYCKNHGIKYGFVAGKLGLYQSEFSDWLHGRRSLDDKRMKILEENFT